MNIKVNDVVYTISPEEEARLLKQVQGMILQEYEKLDLKWRLIGKIPAREILRSLENNARGKHGSDAALFFRPDKKADPCIHLSSVMCAMLQEAMKHVTFEFATDADTATAFKVSVEGQSESGGQVVTYGHLGERENDCAEVS